MARKHLAVFIGGIAEKILAGDKKVELRFSRNQVLPYKKITKDDEIFLKNSGGKIVGSVSVDNVLFYNNLNPEIIHQIKDEYNQQALMNDSFWQKKTKSRYVTIIILKNPIKFLSPLSFNKKDRRPWVILEKNE